MTAITSLLAFLAGGGGKWVLDLIKQKGDSTLQQQKQASEIKLSETEKAFEMYKEIVNSLRKDIEGLNNSIHAMEQEHIKVREKNVELNSKLEAKTAQYDEAKEQLKLTKEQR